MSDFSSEIGDTLYSYLWLFQNSTLCADSIMAKNGVQDKVALEIFFALYRRGYISNIDSKEYIMPSEIDIADFFEISIEGVDYLELHKHWWMRFWFRSIGCPAIVSFITALNADPLWTLVKSLFSCLLSHLSRLQ